MHTVSRSFLCFNSVVLYMLDGYKSTLLSCKYCIYVHERKPMQIYEYGLIDSVPTLSVCVCGGG